MSFTPGGWTKSGQLRAIGVGPDHGKTLYGDDAARALGLEDDPNEITNMTELSIVPGVEIFASGEHEGTRYTLSDVCELARNVNRLGPDGLKLHTAPVGLLNRVAVGHEEDQEVARELTRDDTPAFGTVRNARVRPFRGPDGQWHGTLVADLANVPGGVARAIEAKRFFQVSAEVYDDFKDRFGQRYGKALRRVSLLGFNPPGVKGLADLPMPVRQHGEHLKLVRVVPAGPGRHLCFSEVATMKKPQQLWRFDDNALWDEMMKAAPAIRPDTLRDLYEAVLNFMSRAAAEAGTPAPEVGTFAERQRQLSEQNKVRAWAEAHAKDLARVRQTPEQYVRAFSECQRKRPTLTAAAFTS